MSNYDLDFETAEPSIALNAVFWRLAVALGRTGDSEGNITVDPNELLLEVEERLWRLGGLEK